MTLPGRVVSTHLYRIRFIQDGRHLRASVTGYVGTFDSTVAYWQAIANEVRAVAPRTLLVVDQREGTPLPEEQMGQLLDTLRAFGLADIRMAYVETRLQHFAMAEVVEILACEKGFDVRVFSNEMDAELWLRHGEPQSAANRDG